jgi:hypothetical protein
MLRTILAVVALAAASPTAAQPDIGKATSITIWVTGTVERTRALKDGDPVFANERIATDSTGIGQFEFRDATRLVVGPRSSVTLDRFVYDADRSKTKIAIELVRGAFRFISGRSPNSAYTISTTMATLGVRGTAFDLYVADSGALCLAALSGSVFVCPRGRTCRTHDAIGRYLIVTPDGTFWLLDRWDGALLGGVTFNAAMPFLSSQAQLQPAFRAREAVIARYRATAR